MRISDWSSDVCSSDLLCRDAQVALVLPILDVDQDEHAPRARLLHDLVDRGERASVDVGETVGHVRDHLPPAAGLVERRRATYRASGSTSIFKTSPGRRSRNVV